MKTIISLVALALVVSAAGCTSISVTHDWDREADFTTYKKYGWLPVPETVAGDARTALRSNDLLTKRIRNAVNAQLSAKGMSIDVENPDVALAFHVGSESQINVSSYGYGYGRGFYGRGGSNVDVYQYTKGTLIIDIIDWELKELVFRATATAIIDDNPSMEQSDKVINEAVAKMLTDYPPRVD